MFCKECGSQHPGYINYCPNDGQELLAAFPATVNHKSEGFCAGCGKSVHSSAQYCQHCGVSHSTTHIGATKKSQNSTSNEKAFSIPKINSDTFSVKTLTSILLAVGISILLALSAAYLFKAQIESAVVDASDGEITLSQLQSVENYISKEAESEFGINPNLPNIYNTFTAVSLFHGVDFEFSGEAIGGESGDFIQGSIEMDAQNLTAPLLLIAFIILAISGLVLGFIIKKRDLGVFPSIIGFSLFYGLFIAISSFIASFSYVNSLSAFYFEMDLNIKGRFPLVESFLSGTFLALMIAGSAALFTVYGKKTLTYLQTRTSYIQYLTYNVFLILAGMFSVTAVSLIFLSNSYAAEEMFEYFDFMTAALLGSFSMWVWDLAHLLPITLSIQDYGSSETFVFHLLNSFSENQGEILLVLFNTETLPLWVKLSFLVPALLLAFAGYQLYKTHLLNWMELLKFSALYGGFMVIVKLFTSLNYALTLSSFDDGSETIFWEIHSGLIPVFLISSIFALVFFSAGGFLKRYLSEA